MAGAYREPRATEPSAPVHTHRRRSDTVDPCDGVRPRVDGHRARACPCRWSRADADSGPPVTSVLDDDAITVGSFNFPESEVLAEIYAQALEGRGFHVERAVRRGSPRAPDPRPAARPGGARCPSTRAASSASSAARPPATPPPRTISWRPSSRPRGLTASERRPGRGPQLVRDLRRRPPTSLDVGR